MSLLCMVSVWELRCMVNFYLVIRSMKMMVISRLSLGGMHLAMRRVVYCALASVGCLLMVQTETIASYRVKWDNFLQEFPVSNR